MPKMKSHKGARKRMRVTRKGKVLRGRANRSHLNSGMASKRKRRLRGKETVETRKSRAYRRLLDA